MAYDRGQMEQNTTADIKEQDTKTTSFFTWPLYSGVFCQNIFEPLLCKVFLHLPTIKFSKILTRVFPHHKVPFYPSRTCFQNHSPSLLIIYTSQKPVYWLNTSVIFHFLCLCTADWRSTLSVYLHALLYLNDPKELHPHTKIIITPLKAPQTHEGPTSYINWAISLLGPHSITMMKSLA